MHTAPSSSGEYHNRIDEALHDEFLRKTLDTFAVSYRASREQVFKEVDERGLIKQIADAKDYACQHMTELYEQFKAEAEKIGIHVHWAEDAQEARTIIARIARQNAVKRIVKSKSMTAEEIELNPELERQGFIVDETDLGEWIIQLRHEGPSHMVMPAIHLSRYQVADVFAEATGEQQDSDVQRLVKVARVQLRRKFIAADMGITGANFAVAENAAIATVTNEGNARMVETLPRVHVAIAGIDKLIPSLDQALTALLVLPRNATAQRLTSYVTWMRGPSACASAPDGRKIMHIVFLDNGRSKIAKDPLFKQIFRCVRCGACANVCPVFRLVGGHKMGYIYIGAIGLILTYFFHGKDKAKYLCQNCIGCESCASVCAGGIELPRLIREIRARLTKEDGSVPGALMSAAMKNRKVFHSLLKFAKFAQKPFTGGTQFQRHLPAMFLGKHGFKALPAIADKAFRDRWEEVKPRTTGTPAMRVAIFAGCAQDFIYPEELEACTKVLQAKNVACEFPMEQTCCGLPLEMMGQRTTSLDVARQNVKAFAYARYDYIITLCASCASHLKHAYPKLLADDPEVGSVVQDFADRIIDFSSFAFDKLKLAPSDFENSGEKITYHASCHLCRGLKVKDAPRELIKDAANYVPCDEEEVCCGFGGTYSAKFPEISAQLLQKKLDHVAQTGASTLVVDCPGCVMQLKGGAEKRKMSVKVKHIAEMVAENLKK